MENLKRVTGGYGGESYLFLGAEKTVLHDLGMACFNKELIANIEEALDGRPLDYILLSHTHYDHMGALPYVLKRWPNALVCGCEKTASVFSRESALKMIVSMGKTAAEQYGKDSVEIIADGIRVDIVMKDEDVIDLGAGETVTAYETKGHTDCSMSYFVEPCGLMFASESTGVLEGPESLHGSVLKSFDESLASAKRLKELDIKHLLIPHFGLTSDKTRDIYFDWYIEEALKEKNLIEDCFDQGMSEEEVFKVHESVYWNDVRAKYHPYRAYKMNTEIIIKMVKNNLEAAK